MGWAVAVVGERAGLVEDTMERTRSHGESIRYWGQIYDVNLGTMTLMNRHTIYICDIYRFIGESAKQGRSPHDPMIHYILLTPHSAVLTQLSFFGLGFPAAGFSAANTFGFLLVFFYTTAGVAFLGFSFSVASGKHLLREVSFSGSTWGS